MLGGKEEKEIIQGLTEGSSEIEELLGLVPQESVDSIAEEHDNDESTSNEDEENQGQLSQNVISDDNGSNHSETEDRSLDQSIRAKNAKIPEKMIEKYNKQHTVEVFQEDDIVMLRIPKEDLASTNNRRIACRVLDVLCYNRYKLQTKYGVITHLYPTGQLNSVPIESQAELEKEIWTAPGSKEEHPLRTIALFASSADRVEELDCGNLSKLTEHTEVALGDKTKPGPSTAGTEKTSGPIPLKTGKRARAATTTTQKPVTKKPRGPRNEKSQQQLAIPKPALPGRKTRAQHQQTTLSQYEGMKPIVDRLSNMQRSKAAAPTVTSSSSLSDLSGSDTEYSE
ncbi:MAG: hypothetical protein M1816_002771 [Peltula sp. TS41687]|nr:MAG: hypothetical protein M1816_002771 [Peltula sp. TS41687]